MSKFFPVKAQSFLLSVLWVKKKTIGSYTYLKLVFTLNAFQDFFSSVKFI